MKTSQSLNNDHGYVLVLSLLILLILSIAGVMAVQISTTEVKISGNERAIKNNLYQAEDASVEGGQCIGNQDTLVDLMRMGIWLKQVDGYNMSAPEQTIMDSLEDGDMDKWILEWQATANVDNTTCYSTISGSDNEPDNPTIAKTGWNLGVSRGGGEGGSSLKMTEGTTRYDFKVVGISSQNTGEKTVEIGFHIRLNTTDS